MKIGCFALVEPFSPMERQFAAISEMGIKYADLTDNHNGGMLGVEYGFTASLSLDSHPEKIRKMAAAAGITLTSVCAHANLLDPAGPDRYGTSEIIKSIRLAKLLGIKHVITTEGDPKTAFGDSRHPPAGRAQEHPLVPLKAASGHRGGAAAVRAGLHRQVLSPSPSLRVAILAPWVCGVKSPMGDVA